MPHEEGLPIWVIYDHPKDYPNSYVARCFIYEQPTNSIIVADDLERLRDTMIEMGLVKLMRMPGDDPVILETWL
jgi:hypothetical protein